MKRRIFIKQTSVAALLASIGPAPSLFGYHGNVNGKAKHICIFSKHLQWLGYMDMAVLASEIGFTGIDLTVRNGGHVLPENVRTDLPLAVEQIRDVGLDVPMITTGITDPDDPITHDILETAGKLGIKLYRTGWYRYVKGIKVGEQLDHAKIQLGKLQHINKANNIAASYQNHSGNFIGSSGWDLLHIIDSLDPKWIGVQFDIRHAMVEGPESWPFILELLAPYINSLDIKDYTWENEKEVRVKNVPLGKGLVKFDVFLQKLEELQIDTDCSIHYEYPLGGAEHGTSELTITRESFVNQVGADLSYFKSMLIE